MSYLFVGERRSGRAVSMDVTWEDGRLCAWDLHEALLPLGIDPGKHAWVNLFPDGSTSWEPLGYVLDIIRTYPYGPVIALGSRVSRALEKAAIKHLELDWLVASVRSGQAAWS